MRVAHNTTSEKAYQPWQLLQFKKCNTNYLFAKSKKHLDGIRNIHPELENFLIAANYSYQQFDGDYFLLERTMKILGKDFHPSWKTARKIGLRVKRVWSGYLQEDCMAACVSVKIQLSEGSKFNANLPKGQPDAS